MTTPLRQVRIPVLLGFLMMLSAVFPIHAQQTVYVDVDNPCPGTGTPGDPFCTIMDAVCDIKDTGGGDVIVSPGTYNESILLFRDVSVISTDGPLVTTIDGTGQQCYTRDCVTNTNTTHCSTVIISSIDGIGPTNADRLEGFTITGGTGFFRDFPGGDPDLLVGGGIFVFGASSPTITNNIIVDNIMADANHPDIWYGGGIYIHSNSINTDPAEPIITNNVIEGNIVDSQDGQGSSSTYSLGGGIYVGYHSIPLIEGNTIRSNRTGDSAKTRQSAAGGGIAIYSLNTLPGSPTITRNVIIDNTGTDRGGGISGGPRYDGDLSIFIPAFGTISDNLIEYNSAGEGGGAKFNNVLFVLNNNTIVDNDGVFGGGVSLGPTENVGEEPTLANNIVALNYAETGGGGLYVYQSLPAVRYNDINGNTATAGLLPSEVDGDRTDPDYIGLDGNVSVDPMFVDTTPGAEDYRLQAGSPVIDAGNNADASVLDLDGSPRIQDGDGSSTAEADMGAYEYGTDFDGDGIPDDADPDDDNDGVDDDLDCADFTVGVSQLPAPIGNNMNIGKAGADVVLSWSRIFQGHGANVYRGNFSTAGSWAYDETCLWTEILDGQATDNDDPLSNEGFYYFVTAVNSCGESVMGQYPTAGPTDPALSCTPVNGDFDSDGVIDLEDSCPMHADSTQSDVDLDFAGDLCDNCPAVANPDQRDTDQDNQGDVCDLDDDDDGTPDVEDCAPLNPNASTGPGEITGLTVERSGDDALISWGADVLAARYDLAGGFLLDLTVTGDTSLATCLADNLVGTTWTDNRPAAPPGDAHYYLVRGEELCSGSYGRNSGGSERVTPAACP